MSSSGTTPRARSFLATCTPCRVAIEKPESSRAQVLARRVMREAPPLVALRGKHARTVLRAMIQNYRRLLPHLEPGPRPYCPNEDPMEARGVFLDTRDGPAPGDLN